MPTAGTPEEALAAAIVQRGARVAFGLPGGGANLDMVGALTRTGVRFVLAHGETPACIMASTYGHLTGTVSAAVVTRGPGAAAAINGAAQATLDRYPLLVVTDAVHRAEADRVAHQRLDQSAMFDPVSKASMPLREDTAAVAVDLAAAWPPGNVHLEQDRDAPTKVSPRQPDVGATDPGVVRRAVEAARRPVVILGIGALPTAARVRRAVETFGAPTFTTYQAVGVVPTVSPLNAGLFTNGSGERDLIEQADLVVLIGLDMVEPIPAAWPSDAPVVSIAPVPTTDAYAPIVHEVLGDVGQLAHQCLTGSHDWNADAGAVHRAASLAVLRGHGQAGFGPVELTDIAHDWARHQHRLTTTVDAGAHFLAVMPPWEVAEPKRLLISNGLATMGYAIPAAIGAALARPGDRILALTGDGGLAMTLGELETIARLSLPITVLVFNDSCLSLIHIKQGPDHGGPAAVAYQPTDFAAIATASGIEARVVDSAAELETALAARSDEPLLIDARIDPAAYRHLISVTRGTTMPTATTARRPQPSHGDSGHHH